MRILIFLLSSSCVFTVDENYVNQNKKDIERNYSYPSNNNHMVPSSSSVGTTKDKTPQSDKPEDDQSNPLPDKDFMSIPGIKEPTPNPVPQNPY